jgi:uncharacterized protein YacL
MSVDFTVRLVGALVGAVVLGLFGRELAQLAEDSNSSLYIVSLTFVGILAGLILTPYFTTRPIRQARQSLVSMPPERLIAIILGMFLGLVAALLMAFPLSLLPPPFRQVAPFAAAVILCYLSVTVLSLRQNDLGNLLRNFQPRLTQMGGSGREISDATEDVILLDTSVIIDGRITDISKTGFIRSEFLVPNFVLLELQHVADSPDMIRRNRGRRGLDVLSMLQNESPVPVRITDMDASNVREVDSKLVALARRLHCPIMTNDYNLNRVAELQGVTVLNINDLANAVKAVFLPGEEMHVKIIQEGKEYNQGVGYLEDGTMVVIEDGKEKLNQTVPVTVTKVLQTSAGRMVFGRL